MKSVPLSAFSSSSSVSSSWGLSEMTKSSDNGQQTSNWWFTFSSTSDVIYPNVFSPEMYNLFILIIYAFLAYWLFKLFKTAMSNSYLIYVIRSGAFNIVNIANFENIDSMWGEGNIRSYVQALFRNNISSPALTVKRINGTVHLKKSNFSCFSKDQNGEKFYGINFKFDSLVRTSVQLFWGVSELAFKKKVLLPFKEQFEKKQKSSSNEGVNNDEPQEVEDDGQMTRSLLQVDEQHVDNIMDDDTPLSQIDMNRLLTYDEYTEKSDLAFFDGKLDGTYETPTDELFEANAVNNYFTSMAVRESTPNTAPAEQQEGETAEAQPTEVINTEEERLGNQLTQDLLAGEDEHLTDAKLPLVIVLKPTTKSLDSIKRYDTEDLESDYDCEVQCLYVICNFKKYENSEEGVYYRSNIVKIFAQTESEIFELEEVYGADDNDSNEVEECIVCFTEPREITLLPCKHKCVCHECFSRIDKCPICRSNVRSFISSSNTEGTSTEHAEHNDHNHSDHV